MERVKDLVEAVYEYAKGLKRRCKDEFGN